MLHSEMPAGVGDTFVYSLNLNRRSRFQDFFATMGRLLPVGIVLVMAPFLLPFQIGQRVLLTVSIFLLLFCFGKPRSVYAPPLLSCVLWAASAAG